MVASTRAYSRSGSSETASNNRCQTPAFTQSRKRVKMLFQWPNEGGRARHGLPVRTTHKGLDKQAVVLAASPRITGLAQTTRLHLRPLGVGQNEAVHPKLESQPSLNENP